MRRVVITGVGVVSPIGTGLDAFEEGLATARSGIDLIRSFDASGFATRIAGEVKDDLLASPLLASLPEALAPALRRDRKAIFVLHAGRQALQQAFGGAPPPCPPQRRGVMVSAGLEIFHLQDLLAHLVGGQLAGDRLLQEVLAAPAASHLQIPAHLGPLCLARELGAEGIFSVNLSACAAGTQAIGEAFRAVREGRLDLVVTGGCDSMVNPLGIAGFSRLEALSRSNELGGAASRPLSEHPPDC